MQKMTVDERRMLLDAQAQGIQLGEVDKRALETGYFSVPAPRASLPRRIWLGWWTWTLASLAAVFGGALAGSGIVMGLLLVLAAAAGVYVLRNGTN